MRNSNMIYMTRRARMQIFRPLFVLLTTLSYSKGIPGGKSLGNVDIARKEEEREREREREKERLNSSAYDAISSLEIT